MPPDEKPQPMAQSQPALGKVFALFGQSNQRGPAQLLDHMRAGKGGR